MKMEREDKIIRITDYQGKKSIHIPSDFNKLFKTNYARLRVRKRKLIVEPLEL